MNRTERLLAIVLLLQGRRKMTAARLADILGVSVRTIYRDMDAISLAHVPVTMEYGPGGGYFIPDRFRIDAATFTRDEALAIAVGAAMAHESPLLAEEGLRRALWKLESVLPEEVQGEIRAAGETLLLDQIDWHRPPSREPHLEALRACLWSHHCIDILHRRVDRAEAHWRTVEPLGLICKAGKWYLVAYCRLRKDYRTFRVSRVQEVKMLGEPIQRRRGFDLREYWEATRAHFESSTAPLHVIVRLSPRAVPWLGEEYVTISTEPDGSRIVRLQVERFERAVATILSFGPEAEVLEPAEVGAEAAAAVRAMAIRYASSPGDLV